MNLKKKGENLNFYKTELKKTELLLEINKKIAGLKNLSEILWTIIDFVTENVGGDRGSLFLNDSETNELYSRVAQGELTREIRILNTVGIAGAIFTSQQGEIIHDVYSDRRFNKEVDQETGYKTRNMICTPVKTVNGQIIGVIQILNKKKGRFTKDNLNLVDAMNESIEYLTKKVSGLGGMISVTKDYKYASNYNTPGMIHGVASSENGLITSLEEPLNG